MKVSKKQLLAVSVLACGIVAAPVVLAKDDDDRNRVAARLSGYQEVPSVSTVAAGRFTAEVAADGNVDYQLTYSGLQGQVRQAHIHFAQRGVNGPIMIWLCGTTTNPGPTGTQTCPQSGTVSGTIRPADVLAAPATQQLAAGELAEAVAAMRAGAAYVNVHTDISTGGEIRGQIRRGGGRH
jgi:hypothetical protein